MDKADKKEISRHTSICISSSFHLFFSLIHIQMHTVSFLPSTQTPKDNSSLQCMQIRTQKHTDTDEWMCGQAAFISLHSKNRRQCVHSLTCDAKLILWKILETAQRIKQSLKSLLCRIKKIMETRRSGFSTPDRHNSSVLSLEDKDRLAETTRA